MSIKWNSIYKFYNKVSGKHFFKIDIISPYFSNCHSLPGNIILLKYVFWFSDVDLKFRGVENAIKYCTNHKTKQNKAEI